MIDVMMLKRLRSWLFRTQVSLGGWYQVQTSVFFVMKTREFVATAVLFAVSIMAVHGQGSILSIYVNSTSIYTGLPCGYDYSGMSCPNLSSAFQSLPLLNISINDTVMILFSPGNHIACGVSYRTCTGAMNISSLVLAPWKTTASSTLYCNAAVSNILILDHFGVSHLIRDLKFKTSNSATVRSLNLIPATSQSLSVTTFNITRCVFDTTGSPNTAIYIYIYPPTLPGNFSVSISFSNFSGWSKAIDVASTTVRMLPAVRISSCAFINSAYAAWMTGGVNGLLVTSSFFQNSQLVVGGYGNYMVVYNSYFTLGTFLGNFHAHVQFNNCTFTDLQVQSQVLGGRINLTDCLIANSSSLFFLQGAAPQITDPTEVYFIRVTFFNLTTIILGPPNLPKITLFDSCSFYHKADRKSLFYFSTQEDYGRYQMNFTNCEFFVIGGPSLPAILTRPLFEVNGQVYPSNIFSLINCTFSNMSMNSPMPIFSFYTVWKVQVINCTFDRINNKVMGLFLISKFGTLTMTGCFFTNIQTTFLLVSYSTMFPVIKSTVFKNITISITGLAWLPDGGTLTLKNSNLSNIHVVNRGALVLELESKMNVLNCTFSSFSGHPAFYVSSNSQLSIKGITISQSHSTWLTGGCAFVNNGILSVDQSLFENCTSEGSGGAIFVNDGGLAQINNSIFIGNQAMRSGGVMFISNTAVLSVWDCEFLENSAQGDGGVIYLGFQSENATCIRSLFERNSAKNVGGAIYSESSLFLNQSTFSLNVALQGGAFYGRTFAFQTSSILNTFLQNRATSVSSLGCDSAQGAGGAIFIEVLTVSHLRALNTWVFENNSADYFGGAIGFDIGVNDSVHNFTNFLGFQGNRALYGQDVGSLWKRFSATFEEKRYFTDPLVISFVFEDFFGQKAIGVQCELHQKVNWSLPVGLSISPLNLYARQTSDRVENLSSALIFPTKLNEPLPFPNSSIELSIVVELNSYKVTPAFINFSRQFCPPGAEFVQDENGLSLYSCRSCRSGTYLSYSNGIFAFCQECSVGKYSKSSSSACTVCPAGFETNTMASSICIPCPPGKFNSEVGEACSLCLENHYSDVYNSTTCIRCDGNSVALNKGSSSAYSCICRQGWFGQPWNNQTCKPCIASSGMTCDWNSSIPFISPGFWRDPRFFGIVYECIPSSSCIATELNLSTICETGYQGKRCGQCQNPEYYHFDNLCKKC
jgi:predicted outer membrane repeat protein